MFQLVSTVETRRFGFISVFGLAAKPVLTNSKNSFRKSKTVVCDITNQSTGKTHADENVNFWAEGTGTKS